jgi:hypothetical protein
MIDIHRIILAFSALLFAAVLFEIPLPWRDGLFCYAVIYLVTFGAMCLVNRHPLATFGVLGLLWGFLGGRGRRLPATCLYIRAKAGLRSRRVLGSQGMVKPREVSKPGTQRPNWPPRGTTARPPTSCVG